MDDQKDGRAVTIWLDASHLDALAAWIERHKSARPTLEQAIRHILSHALASARPSTMLPNFTTGRDIV
jgi:hypothetical protein